MLVKHLEIIIRWQLKMCSYVMFLLLMMMMIEDRFEIDWYFMAFAT